jgi:hypothetical protein
MRRDKRIEKIPKRILLPELTESMISRGFGHLVDNQMIINKTMEAYDSFKRSGWWPTKENLDELRRMADEDDDG